MNRIISLALLCTLLLMCFSGCSIPNDANTEKEPVRETSPSTNDSTDNFGQESEANTEQESDPETSPGADNSTDNFDQESAANTEQESTPETFPSTDNSTDISDQENEAYYAALNDFFANMQKDTNGMDKIQFSIERQDLHYQLKESGEYNDEKWSNATILVTVSCNYDLATDEDWYKACSNTDFLTLNTAFFNEYSHEFSEGHFSPWGVLPALHFIYAHSAGTFSEALTTFYSDYTVLKRLIDLEYVTKISIQYFYSVPGSYFDE